MRKSKKDLHPFSKRLKQAREGKYTQEELAEKSSVYLKTLQRLENISADRDPSPLAINLLHLAQVLDVTPEFLLLGEDNMDLYMDILKDELKALNIKQIQYYHKQPLTDKVLAHLKLTDSFIDEIHSYWNENTLRCYRPYVQDTIIRYCHNRPGRSDFLQ